MSPEQAAGQVADKRSDIWSFGVVLFETLTGQRAFTGETVSHVLASVLKTDPNWALVPANTPQPIRRLLRRCLERKPKRRLSDVGEMLIHLEEAATTPAEESSLATSGTNVAQPAVWRKTLPVALGAVVVGSLITGLAVWSLKPSPPQPVTRFSISVPPSVSVTLTPNFNDLAISPDGARVVYFSDGQLYARLSDQLEAAPLRGAMPAVHPFLSPGGVWVGFMAGPGGPLQKVSVFGSPPITICELPADLRGASWGEDDVIIFGTVASSGGLIRVSGAGGEPEAITTPEQGRHTWPDILPGGAGVLFTVDQSGGLGDEDIALLDLDTGEYHVLIPGGTFPRYSPTGHIVYGVEGTLRAVAFDLDTLEVTSDPVPVVEGVLMKSGGAASFDLSETGSLVYISGSSGGIRTSSLVWVDRDGREEMLPLPPGDYLDPRLSPDESALALSVGDSGERDIRVFDLARLSPSRITFGGGNRSPVWSPNGEQLVFFDQASDRLLLAPSAGGGATETLLEGTGTQVPTSWIADGQVVAFYVLSPDTRRDLWVLPMDGDQTPVPFLVTPFHERAGAFSPDGRWLAYVSDESGRDEVYVCPYPSDPSQEVTISTDGGRGPVWSRDSRELFYQNGEQMMVVAVESGESFRPSPPKLLFAGSYVQPISQGLFPQYDVSQDGRFLMMKSAVADDGGTLAQVVLVQNWFEELKRLVPTN